MSSLNNYFNLNRQRIVLVSGVPRAFAEMDAENKTVEMAGKDVIDVASIIISLKEGELIQNALQPFMVGRTLSV